MTVSDADPALRETAPSARPAGSTEETLAVSEQGRRRHLRMLAAMTAATIIVTVLLAGAGWFSGQPSPLILLGAAIALTVGGLAVALALQRYRIDPRPSLFRQYCARRPELLYIREPDQTFDLRPFVRHGLLPRFTSAHLDHQIMGRHRGIAFEIVSAHLDCRRRSMERHVGRPVFQGVLVALDAHSQNAPAAGPILIRRASGRASRSGGGWRRARRHLSPVDWGTGAFGRAYQCHAADQEAARRLLDGPVAACLSALAEAAPRSPIKAALSDGMFLLALPLPKWICRRPSPFRSCRRLAADVDRLDGVVALARALAAGLSRPINSPAQ